MYSFVGFYTRMNYVQNLTVSVRLYVCLMVLLWTESKADVSKISVRPVAVSEQRQSKFYRRSNASSSLSASTASVDERFHCDTAAMCHSTDASNFTFNFVTHVDDSKPDSSTASEIDNATSCNADCSMSSTVRDSNVNKVENASSVKDTTTPATTNTALSFSMSTGGTPFLFNFDPSWSLCKSCS